VQDIVSRPDGDIIATLLDAGDHAGVARIIGISHEAQQKICAAILDAGRIEKMLDQPELDRAAMRAALKRIASASYAASQAVSRAQHLALEHAEPHPVDQRGLRRQSNILAALEIGVRPTRI
jgi:hypothetical protein